MRKTLLQLKKKMSRALASDAAFGLGISFLALIGIWVLLYFGCDLHRAVGIVIMFGFAGIVVNGVLAILPALREKAKKEAQENFTWTQPPLVVLLQNLLHRAAQCCPGGLLRPPRFSR